MRDHVIEDPDMNSSVEDEDRSLDRNTLRSNGLQYLKINEPTPKPHHKKSFDFTAGFNKINEDDEDESK